MDPTSYEAEPKRPHAYIWVQKVRKKGQLKILSTTLSLQMVQMEPETIRIAASDHRGQYFTPPSENSLTLRKEYHTFEKGGPTCVKTQKYICAHTPFDVKGARV